MNPQSISNITSPRGGRVGVSLTHAQALTHITNILNASNATYQEKKNRLADFVIQVQADTTSKYSDFGHRRLSHPDNDESDFNFD